jgi:hypothetical protein
VHTLCQKPLKHKVILQIKFFGIVDLMKIQHSNLSKGWITGESEFDSRRRQKFSFHRHVKNISGINLATCLTGIEDSFLDAKRPEREAAHLVPRLRMRAAKPQLIFTSS